MADDTPRLTTPIGHGRLIPRIVVTGADAVPVAAGIARGLGLAPLAAGEHGAGAVPGHRADAVGAVLAEPRDGAVVACPALSRDERDRLRRHAPGARFVQLPAGGDPLGDDEPGFALEAAPAAELVRAVLALLRP